MKHNSIFKIQKPVLVIAGPTASGKSSLAFQLAQDFNGEIISADSMQIYKNLDIGTAKASKNEMNIIPHHLINVLNIKEPLDVYKFMAMAEKAIKNILNNGKMPIIAGGTGFYIKALLYGLDQLPGDPALRDKLFAEFDNEEGQQKLLEIMKEKAPDDFKRWAKHRRKLIRAYEVFLLTGKSLTTLQTQQAPTLRFPGISWFLNWDRVELKSRIAARTESMLKAGWIEEAKKAIANGLFETPTAHQVLGYKEIDSYLNNEINYEELKQKIATRTWQYARRQSTWFRNQHPEIESISMPQDYSNLKNKLAEKLNSFK